MSIGRNEPCPCGSGQKYKKCCLSKASTENSVNLMQHKLRRAEGDLMNQIEHWVIEEGFGDQVDEAGNYFLSLAPFPLTAEQIEALKNSMLWYYIFLDAPAFESLGGESVLSFAEGFRAEFEIPDFELKVLNAMLDAPFSFMQVEDVIEGKGLYLKDLLLDREFFVAEKSASVVSVKGNIFFTKVITLQKTSLMIAGFPFTLPGRCATNILDLRDQLLASEDFSMKDLVLIKDELIGSYWTLFEVNQMPPIMRNQEGDLIELNELIYHTELPMDALLEQLLPLSPFASVAEMLAADGVEAQQPLQEVSFARIDENDILLAEFVVTPNQVRVMTNSAKRSGRIKSSMTRRFKGKIQLVEQLWHDLSDVSSSDSFEDSPIFNGDNELEDLPPEIQEMLKQKSAEYWQNWLSESVPALKGQTPKQAAKSAKGRELLEALLLEFEGQNQGQGAMSLFEPDIDWLRAQLGME